MDSRFRRARSLAVAALVAIVLPSGGVSWARTDTAYPAGAPMTAAENWILPIGPPGGPAPVVHGFDPPDRAWLPGHRGVDLAAPSGAPIHAVADGVVIYAGQVAGVGVVSISHGDVRSTYQPVAASIRAGDRVSVSDVIGTLDASGGHCRPDTCLHWGAVRGSTYLDPLSLLDTADVRLLPLADRAITEAPPPPGSAGLFWPVAVPQVTSPFGMRVHPITGIRALHDGTDFRAPCGTPIRAAAPGVVTNTGDRGPYGLQVGIDHGVVTGMRTATTSSHLSRVDVGPGQRVTRGQIIGRAGTTGRSTGCHLHFMVYNDGTVADPMSRLPAAHASRTPARRGAR